MNVQEFAALKVGDRVYNGLTQSRGTVTDVTKDGVRVQWGDGFAVTTGGVQFNFSVQGTAWYHWTKEDGPGE